jgi:hypothetical protein
MRGKIRTKTAGSENLPQLLFAPPSPDLSQRNSVCSSRKTKLIFSIVNGMPNGVCNIDFPSGHCRF